MSHLFVIWINIANFEASGISANNLLFLQGKLPRFFKWLLTNHNKMGILIAISVILLWALHLGYMLMFVTFSPQNPWMYIHILVQGWLYTGLFITGHDAMHGTISENKTTNKILGSIATFLFAGMSYKRLRKNHGLHHVAPATEKDPDFYATGRRTPRRRHPAGRTHSAASAAHDALRRD